MKILNIHKIKAKSLIVFDVDGTLAPSKSVMDSGMVDVFKQLLAVKKVAVISGAKYEIMRMQLSGGLKAPKSLLKNLFMFPTTATTFYRFNKAWKRVYALNLTQVEVKKIKNTFERVFKEIGYRHPKKVYGEIIENRGTQVSFSVFGQDIVKVLGKKGIRAKEQWKNKHTPVKMKIARLVAKYLPELEVRAAGFTTIDITKKGIDKAYGLKQIKKHLGIPIKDMLFIGDAIFPGGNDYAVVKTGVDYIQVKDPEETKKIIRALITV